MPALGEILIETITATDPARRDRGLAELACAGSLHEKLEACRALEVFRKRSENLYERVRATLFLHALLRFHIEDDPGLHATGLIPFEGFVELMERRGEQAIGRFWTTLDREGPGAPICGALAQAYEQAAFQTLADQVRRSVRGCAGNRWMFRVGDVSEHPLRIHPALLARESDDGPFPILVERTPVRLDLSHSGWSDIFFLGMDYPEGARVLNISVDLGVRGRDASPRPPIESRLRVISEPVIRLTSIDLKSCKDVETLEELFNFGNDYLGLVKAAVVASGLVPPALEGTRTRLDELLARVVRPGHGIEIVSKVNDIPKGSRLAVSTNLLASLITLVMRATGQARRLEGALGADEASVVVARAILGEWLGGSGGGWQDSGGVFPGVKLIEGVASAPGDPEWGVSRGRLLPRHRLLGAPGNHSPDAFARSLAESLVLVHGGMAQNVGPILNMVTAKYLLRGQAEWKARGQALAIFEQILHAVQANDVRALGGLTTSNWDGPLKTIIPWVTNQFTESIIAQTKAALGDDFWGFLMLGGMSGGGMAFFVAPGRKQEFQARIAEIMRTTKRALEDALPFAMDPVVHDFEINRHGTYAQLETGASALMPAEYYTLQLPRMIAAGSGSIARERRLDIDHFANQADRQADLVKLLRTAVNHLFPVARGGQDSAQAPWDEQAESIRRDNGFDREQHERLREDLLRGRIGLARNRLPIDLDVCDVDDAELLDARGSIAPAVVARGAQILARGGVAAVTLAAGVGSRWTTGAGVVKAVMPFVVMKGQHRAFLEIHLAKTRKIARAHHATLPHVVTTSFLTHSALERHLDRTRSYGHDGPVYLSRGQSIGQRLIPMTRDLLFLWEEQAQETLDENKQKVREASRRAILDWARGAGEGADYTDNAPVQRFNPPGHFHEIPNLLRNGLLAQLLAEHPGVEWLLVHNVDTLGATLDPGVLGLVELSGSPFVFEVIPRRIEDRGGGLARVAGKPRLLEGLAQPRESTEFLLRYYNTLTTWVRIDGLLELFGLTRADLAGAPQKVDAAVRAMAARVPTYLTIKEVKRRWGHGQEDVYPVAQFEKLWGDVTSLPDVDCRFLVVDRARGRQLKDASQLDGWAADGGLAHVASLCDFPARGSQG